MISPQFDAVWQATWPAAEYAQVGGLRVARGLGGGGRVSAARVTGPWDDADIAGAEAQHADWDQPALFAVEDSDSALADALSALGYVSTKPTLILDIATDQLNQPIPPITALEIWPPMAIVRDIWSEQEIGPARQAVMDRVTSRKTAILGRVEDRAAGAGFVAVHDGIGTLHALAVLPQWRRKGLARLMVRRAGQFSAQHGADRLALAVTEGNVGARAAYDEMGFGQIGRYSYWQKP